ncbi:hypothetical protein GH733_016665 [Mirounga leonina]|nr:hypothetical protein GH733_016665 [Mirounga leonina]
MAVVGPSGRLARCYCLRAVRSSLQVPALQLHVSKTAMGASQKDFESAVNQVKLLKKDPGNEVKLKLYALYKQATEGPCNTPKPGLFDLINKAKWDAWNALGSLPKETARQNYVDLVSGLRSSSDSSSQVKPEADKKQAGYETLVITSEDHITKIMLNRPAKKNALNTQMYQEIMLALEAASKDDSTITVFTVVNGPAVGISVTVLGLFDLVYASDRAVEMLIFGKKLTAGEAYAQGLVTEVFPDSTFEKEVWTRLKAYSKLPRNAMRISKQIIRNHEKEKLHAINAEESSILQERWLSDECVNAVMNFLSQKAKL